MKVVSPAQMVSTGDFIGRRVGRFTITSHLASGGMAELFVARQEAVGGFEKDLVLKMLQERYAENPRVVEMFLDEARLAAKLNHQNIVHVYDVDEADGIRYIAMEYIHGETVTDIVRRSIARGSFLPLEHASHIIAETAAGLAYAHESRNPEGRAARIVHRDVSPSNILVTYEGLTKIVDFGIARVQDQIREESGMRPGKVSYMSPEQVRGEPADHRSDIFSLGIILYEITVG
ncbi:MAG: serine/threonine-protein kinase, partial [Polyangia bacterium]